MSLCLNFIVFSFFGHTFVSLWIVIGIGNYNSTWNRGYLFHNDWV